MTFAASYIQKGQKPSSIPNRLESWSQIIKRCRRGDHHAQCEAYKRAWHTVYPAVYRILRNREEAEDVMQESIIRGFERLAELKDPEKYLPWQRMIAVRSALNRWRNEQKVSRLFGDEEWEDEAEDVAAIPPLEPHQITDVIESLPDGYRMVIQLHLLEGMGHEEIGQNLGIASATSRSQYARGIARVKRELMNLYAGEA